MRNNTPLAPPEHRGFTLIELMLTLALAAVIMSLAIPAMGSFSKNGRLTANANDLVHSYQVARTEAIKSQKNIVVCASNSPSTLAADCSNGAFSGWIIFADDNGDWQRQTTEQIIESHATVETSLQVRSDGSGIMSFGPAGFANPPGASGKTITRNVVICDSRGNVNHAGISLGGRAVLIDQTGHARASNKYSDVATAGGCP
jgi:type IV fimbrial biogenesis protein FimT